MSDLPRTRSEPSAIHRRACLGWEGLDALIQALDAQGYDILGPRRESDAIVIGPLAGSNDLPAGLADEQDGGHYRLGAGRPGSYFDYVVGPQSWKKFLLPARQRLLQFRRQGKAFRSIDQETEIPRYAFFGVRPCDLSAIERQDQVFDNGDFADSTYMERRERVFVVVVNCARPGGTCFCASMGTGPRATGGFDLALTEITENGEARFHVEAGSERGADLLATLEPDEATEAEADRANAVSDAAAEAMGRAMIPDVAEVLKRNIETRHWERIAKRCLSCANCTMVCPTCFCTTVEDTTDLAGTTAERWRLWDSCFSVGFSYIHGGAIRRETSSRYRQWMTHKLSTWFDQFGRSGCVGCGRCITWCPVGIDITEEAPAIRDAPD